MTRPVSSVDDEGRPGPLRPYISRTLAAVDRAMAPTRTSSTDRGASPTGSPRRIVSSRRLSTSQTASVEAAVWSGTANRTNNAMTTLSSMVGASDEASSASELVGNLDVPGVHDVFRQAEGGEGLHR